MTQHLLEYYNAFECLLNEQRARGELRTHFGLLPDDDIPADYCFFKSIVAPDSFSHMTERTSRASDALHDVMFRGFDFTRKRLLDVGFGSGGTMARLAKDHPTAQIDGVNLNPLQHDIALQKLGHIENLNFVLADYLQFEPQQPYDCIYLLESAFHISDKQRLLARLCEHLAAGGQALVLDIFSSERLARFRRTSPGSEEEIFDYITVDEWRRNAESFGLTLTSFADMSVEAANHITIRSTEDEFDALVTHALHAAGEHAESLKPRAWEAYRGYKRLGRLFNQGLMLYGLLRFRKPGSDAA